MKIKFLKDYRYPGGGYNDKGEVRTFEDAEFAKWAIDNGFAEEVKESGWWKPKRGDKYWYIGLDNFVHLGTWENSVADNGMLKLGLIFKTEKAGVYCRDYLEAVVTVKQDEGVIDLQEVRERREAGSEHDDVYVYTIAYDFYERKLVIISSFDCMSANGIWFDTRKHADASLDKHRDEWQTILEYDWSRE